MDEVKYDEELDVLEIRKINEKVSHSIEVGESVIIHINSNWKVVGMEIVVASKFLHVPKEQLEKIKNASISTIMQKDNYGVSYMIAMPLTTVESSVYMQPKPIEIPV